MIKIRHARQKGDYWKLSSMSYVIRKGQLRRPTEFGQIVKIQEADGKIITDFKVLPSSSGDRELLIPSVEKYKELFKTPNLVTIAQTT